MPSFPRLRDLYRHFVWHPSGLGWEPCYLQRPTHINTRIGVEGRSMIDTFERTTAQFGSGGGSSSILVRSIVLGCTESSRIELLAGLDAKKLVRCWYLVSARERSSR
jgi:hypothetical protein